jgi:membrane protease YdiL (CAAX protease family)
VFEGLCILAVTLPVAFALRLPTLWVLTPLLPIVLEKRRPADYGLSLERPGSLRFHFVVTGGVFVPYVIGYWLSAHLMRGASFHFALPPDFGHAVVYQFLLIGLPEEFFFRGYLQTQFDRALGTPHSLFGARWGWGLPLVALLFAACHTLDGGLLRLIVFVPGLWFGWLRARTGTILVPATYHAASNLLQAVLRASFAA